ncbi:HNH endonuclease signature motif containing protein [uncultured Dokdonia sp.]|uniref:HNH endonuclease n=1 Tax=uncultured Dokdonia sp. TaxID=575653 RepID=UPI00262D0617|nr:HNH endonuclease signature motif containing protein [uncultured Dokdonia sp.]
MHYWVNQGKTYKEEKAGGYLWAPIKNTKGKSLFHWTNMSKLKPNDIVFNYFKGNILGYCIITSKAYHSPIPSEFSQDVEWAIKGLMADAEYQSFYSPINIESNFEKILDLLPEKYSPLNNTKKANQGYLYEISNSLANKLFSIATVNIETITKFEEDQEKYTIPDVTSRKGLVTSRVGQGEYRRKILKRWNNQCAITKSNLTEVLIASHIIPWRESNNEERLDVDNGILLSPIYDALFDKYYISFKNNGEIILSNVYPKEDYIKLGIMGTEKILNLSVGNKNYLERHREKLYNLNVG